MLIAALAAAAALAGGVPGEKVAELGATRAVVSFEKSYWLRLNPRISIARGGSPVFSEAVPKRVRGRPLDRVNVSGGFAGSFGVRDLDGDGEPEVMLTLDWMGTQCCIWLRIYRFDSERNTYVPLVHWWGHYSSAPRSLRDLESDGRLEFVAQDDRFAGALPIPFVGVFEPIRIWSYDGGALQDVTRKHPKPVGRDAAALWRWYLKLRGTKSVRSVLIAWAADQYLLGRPRGVERALAHALSRGYLAPNYEEFGREDPAAFVRRLKAFLKRTGYIR